MKKLIQRLLDNKAGAFLVLILGILISPFVAIFKWKEITERLKEENKEPDFTKYLERNADNETSFINITVEDTWIRVEEGEFLGQVSKSSHGKNSKESALNWANQLVNDKISEGFRITKYIETQENTLTKYDDWDWHEVPEDLDEFQGYVPGGLYLGWAIDRGLLNHEFIKESGLNKVIADFKDRKITGPKIYENIDGVLDKELLNKAGNRFSLEYFDSYLSDLKIGVAGDLPSIYHLDDTWDNFTKVSEMLDKKLNKMDNR
ncbi:MAG: hypothetical protein COB85_01130 [Bacteroidetes bacterium]|nr:MAG: hypothetical protein COB85_01130 [Bacteroidota bacterium]